MTHEKIILPVQYYKKGIKNNGYTPFMTTYILDNYDEYCADRKRPMVVICPGGGYEMLSTREAEAVAIKMNSFGYNACVVWYSLAPMSFPAAFLDLCEAVKYVRSHSEEWHVDTNKVIIAGFSAGGHLAASLGVYWNSPLVSKYLPYSAQEVKPDGLLLSYPVITTGKYTHEGSIKNVLGDTKEYSEEDVRLEDHVTSSVPPVFMWHTDEDGCVPLENSLSFALACRKNKVPLEYHVFRRGGHGLSLATAETSWPNGAGIQDACSVWPALFENWMKTF